jgi:hypothetical protein
MTDTIQELRVRKAALLEELELIEQFLVLHERLFPQSGGRNVSGSPPDASGARGPRKNEPQEVADRAEALIKAHGRPVQRGDLVKMIEDSGLIIHSKDKNKYIGTVLWRQRHRFVNIEDEGYWLVGMEYESSLNQLRLDS